MYCDSGSSVNRVFRQQRNPMLEGRSPSVLALHPLNLLRRMPFWWIIHRVFTNLKMMVLMVYKEYPTPYSTLLILILCWTIPRGTHSGNARHSREIRSLLWFINVVSSIWRCYSAYVPMQGKMMSSSSRLGSSLPVSSKLKQHLPSQCWMTSCLTTWSARPQHSNIIQSFRASPIGCSPTLSRYVPLLSKFVYPC